MEWLFGSSVTKKRMKKGEHEERRKTLDKRIIIQRQKRHKLTEMDYANLFGLFAFLLCVCVCMVLNIITTTRSLH